MIFGSIGGGGTLGLLIPPSIPMIVYAVLAQESVARLFMAGVIPGILMATPTEAAAFSVTLAIIIALIYKSLSLKVILDSIKEAVKITPPPVGMNLFVIYDSSQT